MKDALRALLIDPNDDSRQELQRALGALGTVWVVESCGSYAAAAQKVAEVAPDLAVVVLDHDPEQAAGLIQSVCQTSPNVVALPASRTHDSSIILRVIRAGAREFLTLPAQPAELTEMLGRLFANRPEPPAAGGRGPQVIAVTGAAGGVGCTSLAVNLATTLAKTSGKETALLDFDLLLGSVDASLDIVTDCSLVGLVQNIDRLDQTLLKRSVVKHASGLYVLPHPVAMEDAAKIDPETLRRVLGLMKSAFPTVVIDTSKGLQSTDFVAFEMADVILLLVQLDLTCLRNTARLLQLFGQFEGMSEKVRLVVNRSGAGDTEISLKKAEETLKMPIRFQIPNATKVFQAARARGAPVDVVAPGSKVHQAILGIAAPLRPFPVADAPKSKRGLFAALF